MYNFFDSLLENPIIAAVTQLDHLNSAIQSPCENIFLLTGNIFNLKEIAHRVQSKYKGIYICVDYIDGFSKDTWGLEYIVTKIKPNGIITSKKNLIKLAKDFGSFTIYRQQVFDSTSLNETIKTVKTTRPHVVEILPGIIPRVIKQVYEETKIPVVASGLIMDRDDVLRSIESGAIGIASSREHIWNIMDKRER